MIADKLPELKNLTPEEKLELSQELWEEVAHLTGMLTVSEQQAQLLEKRLEEYERNPQNTITWEELKRRLLSSR